jgi:hypothetical protein
MAFKEGTWVEHVHAFRDFKALVGELDQKIDGTQLTPHEAMKQVEAAIAAFPSEPKVKKEKN